MKRICKRSHKAFTLVELIATIVIVGTMAMLFLPRILLRQRPATRIQCVNNLKQVGLAFRLWASDNRDRFPMESNIADGGTAEFVPTGLVFPHFAVMSNVMHTPKILRCPADEERTSATNFTSDFNDWKLSYFVGVDAQQSKPAMLLTGDRNLMLANIQVRPGLVLLATNSDLAWTSALHVNQGNVAVSDGSVQQTSTARLRLLIAQSGLATNRLAMP